MGRVVPPSFPQRIRNAVGRRVAVVGVAVLTIVLVGVIGMPLTAGIVVLNRPKPADVIVVYATDGYYNDLYYNRAVQLLARHYGDHVVLPADASGTPGQTEADEARAFVDATGGGLVSKISVCPEDTDEVRSLDRCLARLNAHTVLLIAPAPESRRALMVFKDRLPGYSWYVAAVTDPAAFGSRWWSNRQWAKSYVQGLQRLIYASLGR